MEIYEKYNLMDKPRVLIVMKSVMTKKQTKKHEYCFSWFLPAILDRHNALRSTGFQFVGTSVSEKDSVKCTMNPKINDNGNRPDQGS